MLRKKEQEEKEKEEMKRKEEEFRRKQLEDYEKNRAVDIQEQIRRELERIKVKKIKIDRLE